MGSKLWKWLSDNPGAGAIAIVSMVVGLLSILKDIAKFTVSIWNQAHRAIYWNFDRKLFHYMTVINPKNLYDVPELSAALRQPKVKIFQSLHRLQERHKVRHMGDIDEVEGGLWGVHELME